jgi:hypothetical protein
MLQNSENKISILKNVQLNVFENLTISKKWNFTFLKSI